MTNSIWNGVLFCKHHPWHTFQGIGLTAYYIPGYPDVPEDRVLFDIKRMAFCLGLTLSGTGVRNDFIVSTSDIVEILQAVDSKWFGLMLDIGSLPMEDPYSEIEKLISYAVTWQVKERVKTSNGVQPADFKKLMKIVNESYYQGYFPLETLGEGDPFEKVKALYEQVKDKME